MGRDGDDGPPGHGVFPPRLPALASRRTAYRGYPAPLSAYNTRRAPRPQCPAPVRVASRAARVRLATLRRRMICLTYALTVLPDKSSAAAIRLFDLPWAISARTSDWRRGRARH